MKSCDNCAYHHFTSYEYYDLTEEEFYDPNYTGKLITERNHYCERLDLWFPESNDLEKQASNCEKYKQKKNWDEKVIYDLY